MQFIIHLIEDLRRRTIIGCKLGPKAWRKYFFDFLDINNTSNSKQ